MQLICDICDISSWIFLSVCRINNRLSIHCNFLTSFICYNNYLLTIKMFCLVKSLKCPSNREFFNFIYTDLYKTTTCSNKIKANLFDMKRIVAIEGIIWYPQLCEWLSLKNDNHFFVVKRRLLLSLCLISQKGSLQDILLLILLLLAVVWNYSFSFF